MRGKEIKKKDEMKHAWTGSREPKKRSSGKHRNNTKLPCYFKIIVAGISPFRRKHKLFV